MTPEQQKIMKDEAKAYDLNYYRKPKLILEVSDHWSNGYVQGYNSRDEEVKQVRDTLKDLQYWYIELSEGRVTANYEILEKVNKILNLK